MNEAEFSRMKAAAAEQMREMNARSVAEKEKNGMRATPTLTATGRRRTATGTGEAPAARPEAPPPPPRSQGENNAPGGWDLPFLNRLKTEGDLALILGLLLILLSERSDKKLLFALLYILL